MCLEQERKVWQRQCTDVLTVELTN